MPGAVPVPRARLRCGGQAITIRPTDTQASSQEFLGLGIGLKPNSTNGISNTNRTVRGHVSMENEQKCPFSAKTLSGRSNRDWWPNQLNLNALHTNHPAGNPMGEAFNYAEEFKTLDLAAVKKDIAAVMTNSQAWWPADFGHYG